MDGILRFAGGLALLLTVLVYFNTLNIYIVSPSQNRVLVDKKELQRLQEYEHQCQNADYNLQMAQIIKDGKNHEP